jgi:phospholipase C
MKQGFAKIYAMHCFSQMLDSTLSDRSRDNLPNPVQHGHSYVPRNMPAIGDLFDLFDFDHHRDGDQNGGDHHGR